MKKKLPTDKLWFWIVVNVTLCLTTVIAWFKS